MKLYAALASRIRAMIDEGVLRAGEKIFSVRQASKKYNVSISTVSKAYEILEQEGVIASHPQSGYFVTHKRLVAKGTHLSPDTPNLSQVEIVMTTLRAIREFGTIPLGSPFPDPQLFPLKKLQQYEKALAETNSAWGVLTDLPPGNLDLRQEIARRYLNLQMDISPQDIVITHGATEAINLCLQAVAKAGDTIAIETPGYYALAHAIERMGMKVAEVRTHAQQGIDLDALEALCDNVHIKAVLLTSNFQNPLGSLMPDAHKQALVNFLAERNIPLIEDDVYQELYFDAEAPKPAKYFDKQGLVLHCSSFSKCLAPGYRVGWVAAGKYRAEVEKLMFLNSISIASAPQIAISKLMKREQFNQHLKNLRHTLKSNYILMRNCIESSFPKGTQLSKPQGGYVVWIKLDDSIDVLKLYSLAIAQGISIAPGPIFTRKKELTQFIRLNYSHPWTADIEQAVRNVGILAQSLLTQG